MAYKVKRKYPSYVKSTFAKKIYGFGYHKRKKSYPKWVKSKRERHIYDLGWFKGHAMAKKKPVGISKSGKIMYK